MVATVCDMSETSLVRGRDALLDFTTVHFLATAPEAGLALHRASRDRWRPGYAFHREDRADWLLVAVHRGVGTCRLGGAEQRLAAGSLVAVGPGCHHGFACHTAMTITAVTVEGPDCLPLWRERLAAPVVVPALGPELLTAFDRLHERAVAGGPTAHAECAHLVHLVALGVVRSRTAPVTAGSATWRQAKNLIDREYLHLAGIAEVARRCGVGVPHLARLFRRHGPCSPARYLARLRLRHAGELLARGSTVEAAAEAVGYACPFAFSKAFTRTFGLNPSAYRG